MGQPHGTPAVRACATACDRPRAYTGERAIIGAEDGGRTFTSQWQAWLDSVAGRYMLEWEQRECDALVADVFGFHALQCGLPELQSLRANRMPDRILALDPCTAIDGRTVPQARAEPLHEDADARRAADALGESVTAAVEGGVPDRSLPVPTVNLLGAPSQLRLERFEDLPFAENSLDLVVLPHVLELATDPHRVLREVARVLRPEGRIVVCGFNPLSLWGARHIALAFLPTPFVPKAGPWLGLPRLRDWLKLLSFEIDDVRYGRYRPPCRTQLWLDRWHFIEHAGDRWWPILGAVYIVSAVKRVHGMRIIGPSWRRARAQRARVAVASPQRASSRDDHRYM